MSQRGEKVRVYDDPVELGDDILRGKEEKKTVEVFKRPQGKFQLWHLNLPIANSPGCPCHGFHHRGEDNELKVHLGSPQRRVVERGFWELPQRRVSGGAPPTHLGTYRGGKGGDGQVVFVKIAIGSKRWVARRPEFAPLRTQKTFHVPPIPRVLPRPSAVPPWAR